MTLPLNTSAFHSPDRLRKSSPEPRTSLKRLIMSYGRNFLSSIRGMNVIQMNSGKVCVCVSLY